jgi:hypothetical protein
MKKKIIALVTGIAIFGAFAISNSSSLAGRGVHENDAVYADLPFPGTPHFLV